MKTLERGIGLLLWLSWVLPALRPWLAAFYANLLRPCVRSVRLSRSSLLRLLDCCASADLLTLEGVDDLGVQAGWRLAAVGKRSVTCWADAAQAVRKLRFGQCAWTRFASWDTGRVRITQECVQGASLWKAALCDAQALHRVQDASCSWW